jgi:hypothetical protein
MSVSMQPQTPHTEARLRHLEELAVQHGWGLEVSSPPALPRRGRRRLVTVVMSLVFAIGLPMVAIASDTFTDVPNSNMFHANINNVYRSRVAAGCGPSLYCPKANVTREQMAAFLNRGLGRVGGVDSFTATPNELRTVLEVDSFTIRPGDVTGGNVFVLVTGTVSLAQAIGGICPCGMAVWPEVDGAQHRYGVAFQTIPDVAAPQLGSGSWRTGSASFNVVFPVTSGANHTISLNLDVSRTTAGPMGVTYQLSAMYLPFGPSGNTTPAPAAVTSSDTSLSPAGAP